MVNFQFPTVSLGYSNIAMGVSLQIDVYGWQTHLSMVEFPGCHV
jgi:hypothetical protein